MTQSTPCIGRFVPIVGAAAATLALVLLAGAAQAVSPSSFTESRGYQNCAAAAAREAHIIRLDGRYFIYEHPEARRYYLNGAAFRNGASQPVKVACDTTFSGNRVLNVSVDAGSYAAREIEPIDVARN